MTDFPHEFLGYPQQSSYGLKVDAGLTRSQFGSGNTRQRRKRRSFPATIDLSFKLDQAQFNDWQYFIATYGYDWFRFYLSCPGATDDIVRVKEIRLIDGYSESYNGHNSITVATKAEIRDVSNTADYMLAMNYTTTSYCEQKYTNVKG